MACPPNCPLRHYPHTYEKETAVPPCPNCKSPKCVICETVYVEETAVTENVNDTTAMLEAYRKTTNDLAEQNRLLRKENNHMYEENKKLLAENERLSDRSAMWYGEAANHAEKVAELRPQLDDAERRMKRYQEEILDLERHNEELFAALNSVRNTLMRASDDIEGLIRVD